ncbi:MAG TPA: hypothetical protein VE173_09030, partial [Longimicrobiales bacterium]|nr:hypothetical protein [Longimicrobiales bacterium]
MSPPSGFLQRVYGLLLAAYPRPFRRRFGVGLRFAFGEDLAAARRRGAPAVVWFLAGTSVRTLFWGLR